VAFDKNVQNRHAGVSDFAADAITGPQRDQKRRAHSTSGQVVHVRENRSFHEVGLTLMVPDFVQ